MGQIKAQNYINKINSIFVMRKDQSFQSQQPKRSQLSTLSGGQKLFATQLHYFQQFIFLFPKTTQINFFPYFELIKNEYDFSDTLKEKISKIQKKIGDKKLLTFHFKQAKNLLFIFKKMNPSNLATIRFIDYFEKLNDKITAIENDPNEKSNFIKKYQTQHYLQQIDKTDSLSKQFEMSYRLSKTVSSHNLSSHDRKAKESQFQAIPRFFFRLEEISHHQSNAEHLGNILMLVYQGNKIIGNKGYAIVDHNKIQWWEKRANGPPDINVTVNVEEGKQSNSKTIEDKQKQPEITKQNRNDQRFKLTQIYLGHTEKITSVSISYDQLYMLSTGMDKCIKLWCLRLKTLLAEFYGHLSTIWDVQWASTGFYFLTGGSDKMAILWRTDVPSPQRIFEHQGQVSKVNFLKNPDFACTAGEEGIFRIWRILSGQCIREISFPSQILSFQLSFSGAYIGLYQITGQITIYDLSKGQKINSFRILEGEHTTTLNNIKNQTVIKPHDVAFSEDEKEFAVVTSKHIRLYSMDNLAEKQPQNIYEIQQQKNEKKTQPPKQVIYMGRDVNLTYCKYTRKNLLVIAGTKKVVN